MLRSVKDLQGYAIRATDGVIGKLEDMYFDDEGWAIRYLVMDRGGGLVDVEGVRRPDSSCDQSRASV